MRVVDEKACAAINLLDDCAAEVMLANAPAINES
jgi:hypothetical protein